MRVDAIGGANIGSAFGNACNSGTAYYIGETFYGLWLAILFNAVGNIARGISL